MKVINTMEPYDCLVMGGGPAGSTVGALVAEAGYRTLVVERDRFPRFRVGESLMPASYDIFRRLGVLEQMKASSFVRKASVQFVSHTGKESQPFHFRQHDPHERARTWQVERSRFDAMLFDNAAAKGAECRDGTRVIKVEFQGDRACGARIRLPDGREQDVAARTVVDATGQQTLIAGRLGLKRPDPTLRKAAVWGYFQGAWRAPGEDGGATVILHTQDKEAWFWSIPLSNEMTSVGVVGDVDRLFRGQVSPAKIFAQQRACCSAVDERLAGAEQIGPLHVAKEFSYHTTRAAGDGWVLVG
ncbi:MAG: NAD(P)/FAD-dependent oxidoreductase, partial [Pirellulales bacterium]